MRRNAGLSICKEISFTHDWNLIVNHDKDPGAEFVVAFRQLRLASLLTLLILRRIFDCFPL
jgi:hypothetical protein